MRVTVVDYGLGNLHSVIKAFTHVGAQVDIATEAAQVLAAERLVLPGVGAFADGMRGLTERGHADALRTATARGTPLIGICLGAQLLLGESDEFGRHQGLGIIPGRVVRIPDAGVKVPHVGWNRLVPAADWSGTLLAGTSAGTWAYFVHSFHMLPADAADLLAVADYGSHRITAAVQHGHVTGVQFHPEKSGEAGLAMLRAFIPH
jgi:glutamine amidotransferase